MKLAEVLKYGVVADFQHGNKRDQFAGLLENAAKDPQFGMGLVADFADDHEHPLAPVFRRLANGEAVREGDIQGNGQYLFDNTFIDPSFTFTLHSKTENSNQPHASVSLYHHFEHGPIWSVSTHTGWRKDPNSPTDDWPEHSHSWLLPATEEELTKAVEGYKEDRPTVAAGISRFRDVIQPAEAQRHRSLQQALKYGVAEARANHWGSGSAERSDRMSELSAAAANGDHLAIGVMADALEEDDHPLGPIIRRLYTGEGQVHPRAVALRVFGVPEAGRKGHLLGLTNWRKGNTEVHLANHSDRPYFVFRFSGPHTDGQLKQVADAYVPSTPEEAQEYADRMQEIDSRHAESIKNELKGTPTYAEEEVGPLSRAREQMGLPPLPNEQATHHRSLSQALKYITTKPEEWTHHLADPKKRDLHLIWADVLNDNGKDQLAESVRSEAEGPKRGVVPNPEEGRAYRILTDLNHNHPSPAIRALAHNAIKEVYNNLSDFTPSESEALLIDALRKSEHPADQDAGVFLSASEDYPHQHHPAAKHLRHLQRHQFANAGLHPRLIGDTLYLLDENHPESESYGAPAIRYHAHIGDKQDLDGLVAHAEQLRQQQEAL